MSSLSLNSLLLTLDLAPIQSRAMRKRMYRGLDRGIEGRTYYYSVEPHYQTPHKPSQILQERWSGLVFLLAHRHLNANYSFHAGLSIIHCGVAFRVSLRVKLYLGQARQVAPYLDKSTLT